MYEGVDTVRRGIAEHFEIGEREVGVAATVADEDLQAPQGNRRYLAQQPNRPDRAELVRAQDIVEGSAGGHRRTGASTARFPFFAHASNISRREWERSPSGREVKRDLASPSLSLSWPGSADLGIATICQLSGAYWP